MTYDVNEPQYKKLARELLSKIYSGEYAVESLLPTEHNLSEMFRVSRHTVREALRRLEEQGVVSRRAGVGTRVLAPDGAPRYQQSLGSIDDLMQFGETNARIVKHLRRDYVVDAETAAELGCAPGSHWLRVGTVRVDKREDKLHPVCWTDNYVDPKYKDIGPIVRASPKTLICTLIEQHFGQRVSRVSQTVSATLVPQSLMNTLNVSPGAPALLIIRRYYDEFDKMYIVTRTLHPGTNYKLDMILTRTCGRNFEKKAVRE